jgi:hypothetical protein
MSFSWEHRNLRADNGNGFPIDVRPWNVTDFE